MHRFPRLCPLAFLVGLAGSSALADPPASSTSGVAIVETAQTGSTVPVSLTKPAPSIPPPRSDVGRFRRFTQTPATRPSVGRQPTTDARIHRVQTVPGTMSAGRAGYRPLASHCDRAVRRVGGGGGKPVDQPASRTVRRDHQQPRPGHFAAGERAGRLGRVRRGRQAFPDHAQPNLVDGLSAHHPDSRRHIRNDRARGAAPVSSSGGFYHSVKTISISRYDSRSSWGTRPRTVTISPRRRSTSKSGSWFRPS